jgi:protease IV
MRKNPWLTFLLILLVLGSLFTFLVTSSSISLFGGSGNVKVTHKKSILHLELKGVILDGQKFLKTLIRYRKDPNVKAVVVEINSPGGVVGPSQEIYYELVKTSEEFDKPVIAVATSLLASGAYYAAVAADEVVVAPGTLMGSIGVIMEFAALNKLYDWAKISRYSITTGKYKDSGADYRPMRDDERAYFQNLVDDVLDQFKKAVSDGRGMTPEEVNQIADGRVFTGSQGVKLGMADRMGTVQDAFKVAAELAHLGDDYEIFEAPKKRPSLIEYLMSTDEEEDAYSKSMVLAVDKFWQGFSKNILNSDLNNRPLMIMPGHWDR